MPLPCSIQHCVCTATPSAGFHLWSGDTVSGVASGAWGAVVFSALVQSLVVAAAAILAGRRAWRASLLLPPPLPPLLWLCLYRPGLLARSCGSSPLHYSASKFIEAASPLAKGVHCPAALGGHKGTLGLLPGHLIALYLFI